MNYHNSPIASLQTSTRLSSGLIASILFAGACSQGSSGTGQDTDDTKIATENSSAGEDSTTSTLTSSTDEQESASDSDSTTATNTTDPGTTDDEISDMTFIFDLDIPTGSTDVGETKCPEIEAVIRDFSTAHPDFQRYQGDVPTKGLVQAMLGPDNKPLYVGPSNQLTSEADFNQWYRDTPGVNQRFDFTFTLERDVALDICVYDNQFFFPIDGKGFGDEGLQDENGDLHNFLFTTEIHTKFTYHPGQVFRFIGDDDLWMFIDGKLAIDLGGLHPAAMQEVNLDTLGLDPKVEHRMDIFHAERHTNASTFRIDTDIQFINIPL